MHSARTTNEYGQEVITWTLPSDHIIKATLYKHFEGLADGGGEVEVFISEGGLCILKFPHHYAEGAASELAVAFQNAWGTGQQSGLRAGMEAGE